MKTADRVTDMTPYHPIEPVEILASRLGMDRSEIIKLDANENPYGPSPLVAKALSELDYVNIYPDPESRVLRSTLSDFLSVPEKNILAGSGADEIIDLLLRVMLNPGDNVLNCPPTFGMYDFDTTLNFGNCVNIHRNPDFSLDLNGIQAAVDEFHPKIIFICSPNNPDGRLLTPEEYDFLLDLPSLIVLDEAYVEFTQKDLNLGDHITHIRDVLTHDNLVILRTFSKWAGLAGLRVGYGAFPDWLINSLWKAKQPYNVNLAASVAAIASINDRRFLAENIAKIQNERVRLFNKLQNFPVLIPFSTNSNFILCKVTGMPAKVIRDTLASRGIFIRHYNSSLLQDFIRVSVGKPTDTDSFITQLERIL